MSRKVKQPEKPMDATDRELEASPAGARLGLTLGLSTLATARHVSTDLKGLKNLASNTSLVKSIPRSR